MDSAATARNHMKPTVRGGKLAIMEGKHREPAMCVEKYVEPATIAGTELVEPAP